MGARTETDSSAEQTVLRELLAKTALGDREAFGRLYAATRGAVYAMALSVLKNAEDAADVTQETFVRVWSVAGQYRPDGSPMGWLLTVARNLARMKLRQESRRTDLTEAEWDAIPAKADIPAEDRAVLQTALAALDNGTRQIVLLHASGGLKHREISELLQMPLATVLSRYHRALKKMRAKLEGGDAL